MTLPMAGLAASDLIARTRQHLMGGHGDERNQLASTYDGAGATLTFTYPLGSISRGARLSIGTDTYYVWAVSGNTATITNGEDGSTSGPHSAGETVLVRPRFTDFDILTKLNEAINELAGYGLFQVKTFDFTYSSAVDGYDLAGVTDLESVYSVRYQEPGPYKDWPELPSYEYVLIRDALTADFPSGNGIRVNRGGWPGYDIRVTYTAPFAGSLANTTDVVLDVTRLPSQMADLPPLGAAVKLMAGREIKRNFIESQTDTRRGSEVPPGAIGNSYRGLQVLYQQRIQQELGRLQEQWPYRVR